MRAMTTRAGCLELGYKTNIHPGYIADSNEASAAARLFYNSDFSEAASTVNLQVSNSTAINATGIEMEPDYVSNL
jgi:hypothetical protein